MADIKTPQAKAKLRALCDAAMPGSWFLERQPMDDGAFTWHICTQYRKDFEDKDSLALLFTSEYDLDCPPIKATAEFVAAARTALPDCLDYINTLEASTEALGETCAEWIGESAVQATKIKELEEQVEDWRCIAEDLVRQHCPADDGLYDSVALSANCDAIYALIEAGRMTQVGNAYGRRVFAHFVQEKSDAD